MHSWTLKVSDGFFLRYLEYQNVSAGYFFDHCWYLKKYQTDYFAVVFYEQGFGRSKNNCIIRLMVSAMF